MFRLLVVLQPLEGNSFSMAQLSLWALSGCCCYYFGCSGTCRTLPLEEKSLRRLDSCQALQSCESLSPASSLMLERPWKLTRVVSFKVALKCFGKAEWFCTGRFLYRVVCLELGLPHLGLLEHKFRTEKPILTLNMSPVCCRDLSQNNISGQLPVEICNCTSLKSL